MHANASDSRLHRAFHSARSYFEIFCSELENGTMRNLRNLTFSENELDLVIQKARDLCAAGHPNSNSFDPEEEAVRLSGHGLARQSDLMAVALIFKKNGYLGIHLALAEKAAHIKIHTESLRISIEHDSDMAREHDNGPVHGPVQIPERLFAEVARVSSLWNLSHDHFLATRLLKRQFAMRVNGKSVLNASGLTLVSP